jgi:NADH-quinone oxidoreductase subunit J
LNAAPGTAILAAAVDLGHAWPLLIPIAFGFLAVYLLLPRPQPLPALLGWLAGAVALLIALSFCLRASVLSVGGILFLVFSGIAVISAGCLVTLRNPVYAALSFAMVVLSTCGLFLLQAAPFLMAATIIVYAGAIIVTFIFVIMLAQQQGASDADARSREPFLGALTGFLLLAALVCALQAPVQVQFSTPDPFGLYSSPVSEFSRVRGSAPDRPVELPAGNVAYLGRALFTDYLLAVEVGGTLLLAATIGTILITSRRPEAKS